jgi:hypothetical protein
LSRASFVQEPRYQRLLPCFFLLSTWTFCLPYGLDGVQGRDSRKHCLIFTAPSDASQKFILLVMYMA